MRYQTWLLFFSGILLIGAALFVRIRTVPPKPSLDDETLWNLAFEQAQLGDAERALQIAMEIREPDNREIALQSIADIFVERRDYSNVLRIVRFLPDPYLRILYFANIVHSGNLPKDEAERLIKEAEQNAMQMKFDRQRKFAWLAVCRMWMKIGEIERAWQVAQNLPETQLRHRICGELAVLFAQQGDVERALKIAAQLPDRWEDSAGKAVNPLGLTVAQRQQRMLTNRQEVLKAIAESLAKQGKVEEATKIAQTLESEAVKSQVLDALANANKRVGMPPFVTRAAEETLKFTRQLEQKLGTHGLFYPLTKSLEEQVTLSKALNEARKLKTPEAKVERLVKIATQFYYLPSQTIAAILTEATHYAREIKSPRIKVQALEQIAMCWERVGELGKGQKLRDEAMKIRHRILEVLALKHEIVIKATKTSELEKLKEFIKKTTDPMALDMLLHQTVVELTQRGQVQKAIAIAEELSRSQHQRNMLLKQIAWTLIDKGKVGDAIAIAQNLPPEDKASLFVRVAENLTLKFQKEQAIAFLNEALRLLPSSGKAIENLEVAQIAVAFAKLGETKKAMEIFSRLDENRQRFIKPELIRGLAESGDFEMAIKLVKEMPSERHYFFLLSIAAEAERQGKRELAQKIRLEAQSIALFPQTPTKP
ncbi:MAG: hypothetical protein NZ805_12260 [Armatimonadetes bacterium]|nr:hypothetical protein [Armatimonadota bacterium]MDW8029305.1 hypothetical protein [Armatimonadota bacterium]